MNQLDTVKIQTNRKFYESFDLFSCWINHRKKASKCLFSFNKEIDCFMPWIQIVLLLPKFFGGENNPNTEGIQDVSRKRGLLLSTSSTWMAQNHHKTRPNYLIYGQHITIVMDGTMLDANLFPPSQGKG